MFGMLDYRAHKLFKLLRWPFKPLVYGIKFLAIIIIALYVNAHMSGDPLVGKIVVVALAFEVFGLLYLWLVTMIGNLLNRVFLYIIDVVPAHGRSPAEAMQVLYLGRFGELDLKLSNHLLDWTDQDTKEIVKCLSLRTRLFFGAVIRNRITRIVEILKGHGATTCNHMSVYSLQKDHGLAPSRFENIAVSPITMNYITAYGAIILILYYLA